MPLQRHKNKIVPIKYTLQIEYYAKSWFNDFSLVVVRGRNRNAVKCPQLWEFINLSVLIYWLGQLLFDKVFPNCFGCHSIVGDFDHLAIRLGEQLTGRYFTTLFGIYAIGLGCRLLWLNIPGVNCMRRYDIQEHHRAIGKGYRQHVIFTVDWSNPRGEIDRELEALDINGWFEDWP